MFGLSLSLTNPSILWAAIPATLGVLLAYRQFRGTPATVPSLYILTQLNLPIATSSRSRPPWRLLADLASTLFLIFAASGPKINTTAHRLVIIVDNSLSMATRDASGLTRMEMALTLAKASCEEAGEVEVVVTSPGRRSLTKGFIDSKEGCHHLANVTASYGSGEVEEAVTEYKNGEKMLIVTDRAPKTEPPNSITVKTVSLNPSGYNFAISRLSRSQRTVRAHVVAPDGAAGNLVLRVEGIAESGERRLLREVPVSVVADEEALVPVANENDKGALRVTIAPSTGDGSTDPNPLDNVGWWYQTTDGKPTVTVVTATPSGLTTLKDFKIIERPVQTWEAQQRNWSDESDLIVFHQFAPRLPLPRKPTLFIAPPLAPYLPSRPCANADASPSWWDRVSPFTRYVNFSLLSVKGAACFVPLPSGYQEVVRVPEGPVVVYGASDGFKRIAVGFDLLPFLGRKEPTISILTLNLLKELAKNSDKQQVVDINEIRYLFNKGVARQILPVDAAEIVPGIATISTDKSQPRTVAIHFYSAAESRVLRPEPLAMPFINGGPTSESNVWSKFDLINILVGISMFLTVIIIAALFLPHLTVSFPRRRLRAK